MSEAVNVKSPVKYFNKLVRDRIPEIIKSSGQECKYKILTGDVEYLNALNAKLQEEVHEYLNSLSVEELVDIMDVLEAIINARKCNDEINKIGMDKWYERGGFSKRVFLECVYPKEESE